MMTKINISNLVRIYGSGLCVFMNRSKAIVGEYHPSMLLHFEHFPGEHAPGLPILPTILLLRSNQIHRSYAILSAYSPLGPSLPPWRPIYISYFATGIGMLFIYLFCL